MKIFHSTSESERAMDRCCQALVSKLETSDTITFTELISEAVPAQLHSLARFDSCQIGPGLP